MPSTRRSKRLRDDSASPGTSSTPTPNSATLVSNKSNAASQSAGGQLIAPPKANRTKKTTSKYQIKITSSQQTDSSSLTSEIFYEPRDSCDIILTHEFSKPGSDATQPSATAESSSDQSAASQSETVATLTRYHCRTSVLAASSKWGASVREAVQNDINMSEASCAYNYSAASPAESNAASNAPVVSLDEIQTATSSAATPKQEVQVPQTVTPEQLRSFLDFAHLAALMSLENVCAIACAAFYFDAPIILKQCETFMQQVEAFDLSGSKSQAEAGRIRLLTMLATACDCKLVDSKSKLIRSVTKHWNNDWASRSHLAQSAVPMPAAVHKSAEQKAFDECWTHFTDDVKLAIVAHLSTRHSDHVQAINKECSSATRSAIDVKHSDGVTEKHIPLAALERIKKAVNNVRID